MRKVTGARLALGLLLGALAIVVVALGFTLWGPSGAGLQAEGAPTSLATPEDLLSMLGVTNIVGGFALIFGVTFATAEHRHQTPSSSPSGWSGSTPSWRQSGCRSVPTSGPSWA